jgi:hypothetical protein
LICLTYLPLFVSFLCGLEIAKVGSFVRFKRVTVRLVGSGSHILPETHPYRLFTF